MKKFFWTAALIIIFMVLDNTLMPFLAIYKIFPSLLFVFAICYSIANGKYDGFFIGLIIGFIQDIYFFNVFGVNCLLNMILCVIAGKFGKNIFKENIVLPVFSIFIFSILKGTGIFCIMYFVGNPVNIMTGVYTSIYNAFVGIFMYILVYRLSNVFIKKKWRF